MTATEKLPWYLNFSNWFIVLGVGGALVFAWFALGSPGTGPNPGDYSCLNAQSYETKTKSEGMGVPYTYNPMEDQWIATISGGKLTSVTVYQAKEVPGTPDDTREATSFSLVKKIDNTSFHMTVEGISAVCWD